MMDRGSTKLNSNHQATKRNDFASIFLFSRIYITVLIIFAAFRLILLLVEFDRIGDARFTDVIKSFWMGFRFDAAISSYILILPFFVITLLSFFKYDGNLIRKIIFYFIFITFSVSFTVCAADIPYFGQFFSRFSTAAFKWMDTPGFVFRMIFQEPDYWLYSILFIASVSAFYFILRRIFKMNGLFARYSNLFVKIPISILALGIMFIGIRGRLEKKSPIRVGTAYFSNNAFINQLGLNPNFTLIRSYLDDIDPDNKGIHLLNDGEAVANLQKYLDIQNPDPLNPLSRPIYFPGETPGGYNVVLIIMESMSAAKMSRNGNADDLTPFLDSISNEGIYFDNCYTAGIHTYNGIFSTLFSFPAIFRQYPMKESSMNSYPGLAPALKENGYSTIYFTTHDGQFDNVEGFLKNSQFDRVVEDGDYPPDRVKTTLGVPDDYMFEYSIPILNQLYKTGKPFLSVYMTASFHKPYYIPAYYTPRHSDINKQIIEYSDYALNKMVKMAQKQEWFDRTIFVFIADHGYRTSSNYDIPLDYLHTPLIFFAPKIIPEKKVYHKMAGQIDVFPTVMDLLKTPYVNSTMGIDLFTEERPYIFFNYDDKYGVIDDEWLLIVKLDHSSSLHKYRVNDINNYAPDNPELVTRMKTYAESHLQAYQYVVNNVLKNNSLK